MTEYRKFQRINPKGRVKKTKWSPDANTAPRNYEGPAHCDDCGDLLTLMNTKGHLHRGLANIRCGKCYLKWKREERRKKGEQ